jgi:hypothetical protein
VWPFVAGTDPDFEGIARLHSIDTASGQHTTVKEGIAGPIGEFDEPKAFVGIEPFDDPIDRWTGGCLEGCSAKAGSGSVGTGLWVVGIGVEIATPRITKILFSYFGSWGGYWINSGRRLDLSPD